MYQGGNIFSTAERVFSMKERHLRTLIACFMFFIFDIIRPFGFTIRSDIFFLGVIAIFLVYPYFPSLLWACVFAYCKDCFSPAQSPVNLIETVFIFLFLRYLLGQFHQRLSRRGIPLILIAIHMWLGAQYLVKASPWFVITAFIEAVFIFIGINYIIKKWMKFPYAEYF